LQTVKEIIALVPWGWIVALILGVIAVRAVKPAIHRFFERANKVTAGSFAAEASPQQIAAETKPLSKGIAIEMAATPDSYEEFQKAIQPFRFASMNRRVEKVKETVDISQFTVEQLREMMTDVAGLILMATEFENLYSLIFGSQIVLLQDLNSVYVTGRPVEAVKPFYETAARTFAAVYQNYSFDQWLAFLVSSGLITRDGNVVKMTEEGRDFLRYLVQVGKPMFKPS